MITRLICKIIPAICEMVVVLTLTVQGFAADQTPLESVRPFIGTAEHGHVYPGATVPFGMVQLSPDTRLKTWDGCSGYHYSDTSLLGFSHTHLSGTGGADLGDIRLTPLSGPVPRAGQDGYSCRFLHNDESARPGFYSVVLQDPKIKVELTATFHAGFHRYTFPKNQMAHLVLDLARGIGNQPIEGSVVAEKNTVLSGYRHTRGWARDKTYFFVAEFLRPFDSVSFEVDGKPVAEDIRQAKGRRVLAQVDFKDAGEPILVKVGLSAVSVEGARKNLAAEIPAMDFDGTVAAAAKSWSDVLNKIDIQVEDPVIRETFYTALYHASLAPTLFNDVDGSYRGLDHKVHEPEGFQNYSTFSLWDTFRAEHPMLTIVQPQRVDDFINSMLAHYRQFVNQQGESEHSLPVWSLAGSETWCMIGYHSVPVIAEAYAKGFRNYDVEAVYQSMRDTAMQDRNNLKEYREKGYISTADKKNEQKQSVSRTLEYAYDDWCIAQMARMLGKDEDAKLFSKRAEYYRNVFDPSVGFMRGKSAAGKWREPFDTCELVWPDYTEATSWNYTWFVPQDVSSLVTLMGGDEKFIEKLDKMFSESSGVLANIPDLTGLIGQYIHGNEPCHHVGYLYNYAGDPWKTQKRIR
jgi:predicted alpha-1,2-mannosidase